MTKWWEDLTGPRGFNRTGVRRPPCSLLQRKNSLNSQDVLVVNSPHFKNDLWKLTGRIADLPRHLLRIANILEESRIWHVICCTLRASWKVLELRVSRGKCYVPPLLHLRSSRSSSPFPSLREPVRYARCPVRYPRAPDWSHCFRCNRSTLNVTFLRCTRPDSPLYFSCDFLPIPNPLLSASVT